MKTEWCYYKQILNEHECNSILEYAKKIPASDGVIKADQNFLESNTRRSKVRFIGAEAHEMRWLFDKLWGLTKFTNENYFNNFDINTLDFVQVATYDSSNQGEYTMHQDILWIEHHRPLQRKISLTLQLSKSDSYSGGDFVFKDLQGSSPSETNMQEMRQQGTVIIFPSFVPHAVLPVTSGTRYSLTAWFEGPNWR